jgi:uncharacterized protein (TIGR00159 family)
MHELVTILGEVGWSGLADIALMTILCYGALEWLRASRTRRLLPGMLLLAGVYLAARFFELKLAATAIEALFVVVVVAAIVLYGDEIRRVIEGMARFGRKAKGPADRSDVTTLARVLFDLARERTGALVVLEGRDPVGTLMSGGVDLDGMISEPLLKSLFDPRSIGHDGAMVVHNGRVWRFACHLPLSSNFDQLGHRGTRHAAALGLSERSDALTIAVSEERGTVSVCERGKLEEMADAEQLLERLRAFVAQGAEGQAMAAPTRRWHPGLLVWAVVVSSLAWLALVHGARPVQRSYTIPVETAFLPADLRVQRVFPERVTITVTGAGRDFYLVRERALRAVVALSDATPGQRAAVIGPSEVALPRGLTLKSVQPGQVSLSLLRR